jgi:ABC-type protease/lipase transport system, ATPase and permease components
VSGVPELGDALRACRSAFIGVGAMSCMINLLYLTGSIFMLEIYDRVLPAGAYRPWSVWSFSPADCTSPRASST